MKYNFDWKKFKICKECGAERQSEEDGRGFCEYKEGTDEMVSQFWVCSKHIIQEIMYPSLSNLSSES